VANTIILKQSPTASNVPTSGELVTGELAINTADKKLYSKDATTVFEIGGATAAADVGAGDLPSDVIPYVALQTGSSDFKVPFLNTTGNVAGNFGLLMDNGAAPTYNPASNLLSSVNLAGDFPLPPQMLYGMGGDYSSTGGAATWGATIWSLDTSWKGGAAAVNSVSTGVYGLRWLRASHAEAHSQVGEGLYGYVNSTQLWGAGESGIAIFNGDRFSAYSVGNDKVVQIVHNDVDGVIAASSSGALLFTTATHFSFDDDVITTGGMSTTGAITDHGQVGQIALMDVTSGVSRFGSYNYDTSLWTPLGVHGLDIEYEAASGTDSHVWKIASAEHLRLDSTGLKMQFGGTTEGFFIFASGDQTIIRPRDAAGTAWDSTADLSYDRSSNRWRFDTPLDIEGAIYTSTTHANWQTAYTYVNNLTATEAELNLLDLSGLTAGWVLSADTATTASWKAPAGGGGTVSGTGTDNFLAVWNGTANIDATGSFLITNAVDKTATETVTGAWGFSHATFGTFNINCISTTQAAAIKYSNTDGVKGYAGFHDTLGFKVWNTGGSDSGFAVSIAGAITAVSYGGIASADLLDKAAAEVVTGAWSVPSLIVAKTASYTMILTDAGQTVRFTGATASKVCTIPANSSVAYPIGTMIGITNDGSVTMTLAITTDTLTWGKDNTTGTRTLAAGADCVIHKTTATTWKINGSALVT